MSQAETLKRKRKKPKGKVIRVSEDVEKFLRKAKKGNPKEPFDSVLRRLFGLRPSAPGKDFSPLETYWLAPEALTVRRTKAEARGEAIKFAVRKGRTRVLKGVVKLREVR